MKTEFDDIIFKLKTLIKQTKKNSEKIFFEIISNENLQELKKVINNIENVFSECNNCFYIKENGFCYSCMDQKRNKNKICLVSTIADAKAIMEKEIFFGTFHILKGEIDLNKNVSPSELKIKELFDRINNSDIEIIIALNSTFRGELTSNYIIQELKLKNVKVSRLARGIPFGGVVNYVDKETMQNAIRNRKKL